MKIIIENLETGETITLRQSKGRIPKGWKIKEIIQDSTPATKIEAGIAVWATKMGLPVPQFLDAARWLLQKDCPFCQLGTQVLRRIDELGEDKAKELVARILAAKEANDLATLEQIKKEMTDGSN